MKKILERVLIKFAKILKVDLLSHAHVQIGVGHNTYISGEEYFVEIILPKLLGYDPKIIFDVGANIGLYAKLLRRCYQLSEIHCFEPIEKNFIQLINNTKNQNLTYNHIGLSSKKENLDMFIGSANEDGSMATIYPDTIKKIFTFAGEIKEPNHCEFNTLDNYCLDNKVNSIDFLKIDVEGHELEVLRGAIDNINRNTIKIIQFEFNEFNISSRSFMRDFYDILPQYSFYRIMPQNYLIPLGDYSSNLEVFKYQNIIAINKLTVK